MNEAGIRLIADLVTLISPGSRQAKWWRDTAVSMGWCCLWMGGYVGDWTVWLWAALSVAALAWLDGFVSGAVRFMARRSTETQEEP